MKILIIYAHPSKGSFTYEVLQQFSKGLEETGHQIELSDLYQIDFQTDMTEAEYFREGFSNTNLPIPQDVQIEHGKLRRADAVCFLYPVWWSDCPAKLKGWFDRVYTVGYAYSKTEEPRAMKTIHKALVICTDGHPNELLEKNGIAESMRKIMLNDRLGNRFSKKKMIILGGTLDGDIFKDAHLQKAFNLGKNFENNFI